MTKPLWEHELAYTFGLDFEADCCINGWTETYHSSYGCAESIEDGCPGHDVPCDCEVAQAYRFYAYTVPEMVEAILELSELADDDDYIPDSFTMQPIEHLAARLKSMVEEKGTNDRTA